MNSYWGFTINNCWEPSQKPTTHQQWVNPISWRLWAADLNHSAVPCTHMYIAYISTFNIMYRWENPDRMAEYALLGENNTIVDRQRNMLLKFPFNFQFWSIIFGLFPNCVQKIKTVNNHDSVLIGHSFPLFLFIRKKVIVQESGPINALLWR